MHVRPTGARQLNVHLSILSLYGISSKMVLIMTFIFNICHFSECDVGLMSFEIKLGAQGSLYSRTNKRILPSELRWRKCRLSTIENNGL